MQRGKGQHQEKQDRIDFFVQRVRTLGLKLTPQRLAIVKEIAADPTHPTAQELFDRLHAEMPTMSFATVYNTLDALVKSDLCHALSLSPGSSRFDPNMHPHHHAVCNKCGSIRDVIESPSRGQNSRAIAHFEVHSVETIYRGVCERCAKKRKQPIDGT